MKNFFLYAIVLLPVIIGFLSGADGTIKEQFCHSACSLYDDTLISCKAPAKEQCGCTSFDPTAPIDPHPKKNKTVQIQVSNVESEPDDSELEVEEEIPPPEIPTRSEADGPEGRGGLEGDADSGSGTGTGEEDNTVAIAIGATAGALLLLILLGLACFWFLVLRKKRRVANQDAPGDNPIDSDKVESPESGPGMNAPDGTLSTGTVDPASTAAGSTVTVE